MLNFKPTIDGTAGWYTITLLGEVAECRCEILGEGRTYIDSMFSGIASTEITAAVQDWNCWLRAGVVQGGTQ